MCSGEIEALTFGGTGAPTGMFLITGSGWNAALLNVASNDPIAIGPWMLTPFFTNDIDDEGCVQKDPWYVWALFVNWIAGAAFFFSATSVSMSLCPLEPCQFVNVQLVLAAQMFVPLPLIVIVPAASITALPVYVTLLEIVTLLSKKMLPLIVRACVEAFHVSCPVLGPVCEMHV